MLFGATKRFLRILSPMNLPRSLLQQLDLGHTRMRTTQGAGNTHTKYLFRSPEFPPGFYCLIAEPPKR